VRLSVVYVRDTTVPRFNPPAEPARTVGRTDRQIFYGRTGPDRRPLYNFDQRLLVSLSVTVASMGGQANTDVVNDWLWRWRSRAGRIRSKRFETNYSSCTVRSSSQNIWSSSGGAQEKGKTRMNANVLFCRLFLILSHPMYDQTQDSGAVFLLLHSGLNLLYNYNSVSVRPSRCRSWFQDLDGRTGPGLEIGQCRGRQGRGRAGRQGRAAGARQGGQAKRPGKF
jgi:hypothetical protein